MTFSAALAVSASGCIGLECEPERSAKLIHLPAECSPAIGPAWPSTTTSVLCQPSGCAPTGYHGPACFAAGSRARTSAWLGGRQGSMARVRAYGPTWHAWCVSADRVGWWLRTFLACEAGVRTKSCVSWRLRATPAGRWWWVLSMPERRIDGAAFGWWPKPLLPTLVARDWKHGSLRQQERRRACQLNDAVGGRLHPDYAEWMMGFPEGWTASMPSNVGGSASRRLAMRPCRRTPR